MLPGKIRVKSGEMFEEEHQEIVSQTVEVPAFHVAPTGGVESLNPSPPIGEFRRTQVPTKSPISKKDLSSRNLSQVYNLKFENSI